MSAETIIDEIGDEQGWNDSSKLALCLQYIDNQCSDNAFEDFLRTQANDENSTGLIEDFGDCPSVEERYPS